MNTLRRLALAACLVFLANTASAGYIDFVGNSGGTISGVNGGPLTGNINIDSVRGQFTPANDGVSFNVTNGKLVFDTGKMVSSGNYIGGSMTMTGQLPGMGGVQQLFTSPLGYVTVTELFGGTFQAVVGGGSGTINPALASLYGVVNTPTSEVFSIGFTVLFTNTSSPGQTFTSTIRSVDAAIDVTYMGSAVPEPATAVMTAVGFGGVAAMARKKKKPIPSSDTEVNDDDDVIDTDLDDDDLDDEELDAENDDLDDEDDDE